MAEMTEHFRVEMPPTVAPVCLIRGAADGLHVTEEGVSLLESLTEPVAIVCLAGQYRTGKSFFLNQLAARRPQAANSQDASGSSGGSDTSGFRVGPTTESCTRGIWVWAPQPAIRNAAGQRVLFLDTEGMASTDNDESYDAKIFSLGLLLSSLFVFNTMGVIDEGAIDRLYLVSELTKHVCVSAHTAATDGQSSVDDDALAGDVDALAESRALAPHFPPFVWLLRDFLLDMQADGSALSANEYLEKALEAREVGASASDSARARQEERNRTRASIRVLFARRECLTLVRPVTDERELRHAAELTEQQLRPEFVAQMASVRTRLLEAVRAKELLGKTLQGPQLAQLARCYTDTMNSGAVPDIKAAWEYVSDATCQAALAAAVDAYDVAMVAASGKRKERRTPADASGDSTEDDEDDEDDVDVSEAEEDDKDGSTILSQADFEAIYKDAQEQAMALFKARSVEGAARAVCFQKLKQHMHSRRATLISRLQKRSSRYCVKVLARLRARFLTRPLAAGAWDAAADKAEAFQATLDVLEEVYERESRGPAARKAFYQFLRTDVLAFFEALFQRVAAARKESEAAWTHEKQQLEHAHQSDEMAWQQQLQAKSMEAQQLLDAKTHLEEKVAAAAERIEELQERAEQQDAAMKDLETKRSALQSEVGELQVASGELTLQLEKTQLRLEHKQEALEKTETEAQQSKQQLTQQVEALREAHQGDKEQWMRRAADQAAEKTTLQKQLKQATLESQQQQRKFQLLDKEKRILQQRLDVETETRVRHANECDALREVNARLQRQVDEGAARQQSVQTAAERERRLLETRLERFQSQLGRLEGHREVEETLRDCVTEVERLADVDKVLTLQEERRLLQEQLGELHEKISTLPDFYVRQVFCAPEPVPSFFDALTSVVGKPSEW